MPRFTGQNKKRINPRYFLHETIDEGSWWESNPDATPKELEIYKLQVGKELTRKQDIEDARAGIAPLVPVPKAAPGGLGDEWNQSMIQSGEAAISEDDKIRVANAIKNKDMSEKVIISHVVPANEEDPNGPRIAYVRVGEKKFKITTV